MPTRLVRDGLIESDPFDELGLEWEPYYIRLLLIVDDYGRYDATLRALTARMFPLKREISTEQVAAFLQRAESLHMVRLYEHGGKHYLQIENFRQRIRGRSKWPAPPGVVDGEAQDDDGTAPPQDRERPPQAANRPQEAGEEPPRAAPCPPTAGNCPQLAAQDVDGGGAVGDLTTTPKKARGGNRAHAAPDLQTIVTGHHREFASSIQRCRPEWGGEITHWEWPLVAMSWNVEAGNISPETFDIIRAYLDAEPPNANRYDYPDDRELFIRRFSTVRQKAEHWARRTKWHTRHLAGARKEEEQARNRRLQEEAEALSPEERLRLVNELRELNGKPPLTPEEEAAFRQQ